MSNRNNDKPKAQPDYVRNAREALGMSASKLAAAPELAEALRAAIDWDQKHSTCDVAPEWLFAARAALAKAGL